MPAEFEILPLTPRLGAEIRGLELTRLEPGDFDRLQRAWLDYKVLFLRDQVLDLEQLQQFSARFGELMQLPYIRPLDGYPSIIRVLKQADEIDMGVFGGDWHSDFSFLEVPPGASILYAEEIPPVGGDTLWADMTTALAALPAGLRARLQRRQGVHSGAPYGIEHAPPEDTQFRGSIEIERGNPEADRKTLHPLICRHPQTGEATLFVNPTYTVGIEGLAPADAGELLQTLFRHCTRPEFVCRFKWSPHCVALWDNRNTMHYAVNDYDGYRRCLYRTTIRGERPQPV